jgi:hypothetical protein
MGDGRRAWQGKDGEGSCKEEGAMRSWLVMILLRQLATVVPDAILKDRTRVEKIGQRVLEIRKDFLIQGQYNIYDRNGLKGTFNLSRVFPANCLQKKRATAESLTP